MRREKSNSVHGKGLGPPAAALLKQARNFAEDRSGSSVTEYAITLGGLGLGVSGITSVIGVDLEAIFRDIGREFCLMVSNICYF